MNHALFRYSIVPALLLIHPPSDVPRIERRGTDAVLVLTPPMRSALQAFDSSFASRRLSDYPPWLHAPSCPAPPDCPQPSIPVTGRQAIFAVIGDFNGDSVLDVVVDGDNGHEGARLVIMSQGSSFRVEKLASLGVVPPQIRQFRDRPRTASEAELGVGDGLSLVRPGTYRSPYQPEPLVLKTDAFERIYFEKASSIVYYRDGAWHEFTTSD